MCEPASIIAVAGLVISAVATSQQMQAQAKQAKVQNRAYAENARRANEDTVRGYDAVNNRIGEERAAADAQVEDNRREVQRGRATATVGAGEANISGLSVENLLRDFSGREADFSERTYENLDNTERQLRLESQGVRARGEDRIASSQRANGPSWVDGALRIGGAAADAGSRYYASRPRTASSTTPTRNP